MKVAGIVPREVMQDPKIQHAVNEPYGLSKVLAIAKQDGHEVDFFLNNSTEKELVERVVKFNPDIAAFSLYTSQYPAGIRVAKELKKKLPNLTLIAGNRYPTFLGKEISQPFDFFAVNEGEATFQEFLNQMETKKEFEKIDGLVFKRDGKVIVTKRRERITDLDKYPNALRFKEILSQTYKAISIPPLSKNPHYAVIEYSRGCNNACHFCDNGIFWKTKQAGVIYRSAKKVVEEMKEIMKMAEPLIFYFMDLNFTSDTKKAMELVDEMIKQRLNASWYCMSNISTADNNELLLKKMKDAGCFKIAFGIESTNDRSLAKMNKSTDGVMMKREQVIRVLNKTRELGILNQGYYIIGFEWDSEKSLLEDCKLLSKIPIHLLNVGIYTPIPLSGFYEKYKKMKIDPNLENHDRNTLVFKHPTGLTNTILKKLQKKMHDEFYESKEYKKRMNDLINVDQRFKQGFIDYFNFIKKKITL